MEWPDAFAAGALLRTASLCVALAAAETLHGIVRTVAVTPRIGKAKALMASALTGSLLALCIGYWLVPPIGLSGVLQHLALGGVLALFMAAFDMALGRWVLRKPWRRIADDFDPRTGNFLIFGLVFLCGMPLLVAWIR